MSVTQTLVSHLKVVSFLSRPPPRLCSWIIWADKATLWDTVYTCTLLMLFCARNIHLLYISIQHNAPLGLSLTSRLWPKQYYISFLFCFCMTLFTASFPLIILFNTNNSTLYKLVLVPLVLFKLHRECNASVLFLYLELFWLMKMIKAKWKQ